MDRRPRDCGDDWLWITPAHFLDLGEAGLMAKPIDPNRWEEFPSRRAARSTSDRSSTAAAAAFSTDTARSANAARCALRIVADFGVQAIGDEPPIPVVAGLVGQISDQVCAGTSDDIGGDVDGDVAVGVDPRGLPVHASGVVSVPGGFVASGHDLLMLFAELIGDQPVPPPIARLLLAKAETDIGQLSAALQPLGSAVEVADFMARRDEREGAGVGVARRAGGERQSESPTAERSSGSTPIPDPGSASGRGILGGMTRPRIVAVVAGLSFVSVAAMVLLGGVSGEELGDIAGGPAAVASGPATTVGPEQNQSPSPVVASATPSSAAPKAGGTQRGATPYPTSWAAQLAKLDAARAAAFATGDKALLADVNIAGSPSARMDEQLLEDLVSIGALAQGLGSTINDVEVVTASASEARLALTDVLGAYQIVAKADGSIIESREQRSQQSWEVTLRPIDGQWRIYQAAPR